MAESSFLKYKNAPYLELENYKAPKGIRSYYVTMDDGINLRICHWINETKNSNGTILLQQGHLLEHLITNVSPKSMVKLPKSPIGIMPSECTVVGNLTLSGAMNSNSILTLIFKVKVLHLNCFQSV